jgi:hypothetical protein
MGCCSVGAKRNVDIRNKSSNNGHLFAIDEGIWLFSATTS